MCTLRAEQIKKTKTILRVYRCDNEGVYRRLNTAKNNSKDIKRGFFVVPASTNAGEKKLQREEKR